MGGNNSTQKTAAVYADKLKTAAKPMAANVMNQVRSAATDIAKYQMQQATNAVSGRLRNPVSPTPVDSAWAGQRFVAYDGAYESLKKDVSGGYTGGCDSCFTGGASDDISPSLVATATYAASPASLAKSRLVELILESAKNDFAISLPQNASPDEKLKIFLKELPSPDKLASTTDGQKRNCMKLAKSINSIYEAAGGKAIISLDMKPEAVCEAIYEITGSLVAGMHSEFLSVYNDVRQTIENLYVMRDLLKTSFERSIEVATNAGRGSDVAQIRGMYEMIDTETQRQLEVLNNLMGAPFTPAIKSLSDLLRVPGAIKGYISKIQYGSSADMSKVNGAIIDVLNSYAITGSFARIIDSALKQVGSSIKEYADKDADLTKMLSSWSQNAMKIAPDERSVVMDAISLLIKNFPKREEIKTKFDAINKSGGYSGGYSGGAGRRGGVDPAIVPMDSRISATKNLRKLVFNAFLSELNNLFNRLGSNINQIAHKIGKDLPITTHLIDFRTVMQKVSSISINEKNIFFALVGFYSDASNKQKKETFLSDMRMVSSVVGTLIELPENAPSVGILRDTKATVDAIIALVDKYSDEVATKFGRGEKRTGAGISGGDDDADEGFAGGDGESVFDNLNPIKFKSALSINDAIGIFDYNLKVSQIKDNLASAGKEITHYAENYGKIVTSAISEKLKEELAKYKAEAKELDDLMALAVAPAADGFFEAATDVSYKAEIAKAKTFLDGQWQAKKNVWIAIEALDSYMRIFTDALVKNPNDVKDIKAMLSDIEVIADWSPSGAAVSLTRVFDNFPRTTLNNGLTVAEIPFASNDRRQRANDGKHYYDINNKLETGNPYLVTPPRFALDARNEIKKMFTQFGALKNLLSIFTFIGNKFGTEELKGKTFLTPAQIYTYLVDYLQASAFAQGMPTTNNYANNSIRGLHGQEFMFATLTGFGAVGGGNDNFGARNHLYFKRRFGVRMASVVEGKTRNAGGAITMDEYVSGSKAPVSFEIENKYFVLMLKSVVAKIFTVVGMYDVLDRPAEYNGPSNSIRMILGGSSEVPKVDNNAVELYLRLPLLCQFYKALFDRGSFEDYPGMTNADDNRAKIAMLPDIEGSFGGLIRLMFMRVRITDETSLKQLSDEEIKDLIRECNKIAQGGKSAIDIIREFVAEVNKRYGVVLKSTSDNFEDEFGTKYSYTSSNPADTYDATLPILPGEESADIPATSAAVRSLDDTSSLGLNNARKGLFKVSLQHSVLLKKFRNILDKFFEETNNEQFSFAKAIRDAQKNLSRESRDEERFKIVASLVRGTDLYSKIEGTKIVLFHETVTSGLNLLSGIHTMLARFKKSVLLANLDTLRWAVGQYFSTGGASADTTAFVANLRTALGRMKAFSENDEELARLLNFLVGYQENNIAHGGNAAIETWDAKMIANLRLAAVNRIHAGGLNPVPGAGGNIGSGGNAVATALNGLGTDNTAAYLQTGSAPAVFDDAMRRRVDSFIYHMFSRERIMKLLIESLYGLAADTNGLVNMRFDRNMLLVDYSQLKLLVEKMFGHVSYFLEQLKPYIPDELYQNATNKVNPGSYYWLQEQLMEKIIAGRPGDRAPRAPPAGMPAPRNQRYENLDDVMRAASDTFSELTKSHLILPIDAMGAYVVNPITHTTHFGNLFAEMIFYDAAKHNSGIAVSSDANSVDNAQSNGAVTPPQMVKFSTNPYEKMLVNQATKMVDLRFFARFYQLYTWRKEFTLNRSLLFTFNQMIAKFIQMLYDPVSMKIYSGLVLPFANGPFSESIANPINNTFPDMVPLALSMFKPPSEGKARGLGNLITFPANPDKASVREMQAFIAERVTAGALNINPIPVAATGADTALVAVDIRTPAAMAPELRNAHNLMGTEYIRRVAVSLIYDVQNAHREYLATIGGLNVIPPGLGMLAIVGHDNRAYEAARVRLAAADFYEDAIAFNAISDRAAREIFCMRPIKQPPQRFFTALNAIHMTAALAEVVRAVPDYDRAWAFMTLLAQDGPLVDGLDMTLAANVETFVRRFIAYLYLSDNTILIAAEKMALMAALLVVGGGTVHADIIADFAALGGGAPFGPLAIQFDANVHANRPNYAAPLAINAAFGGVVTAAAVGGGFNVRYTTVAPHAPIGPGQMSGISVGVAAGAMAAVPPGYIDVSASFGADPPITDFAVGAGGGNIAAAVVATADAAYTAILNALTAAPQPIVGAMEFLRQTMIVLASTDTVGAVVHPGNTIGFAAGYPGTPYIDGGHLAIPNQAPVAMAGDMNAGFGAVFDGIFPDAAAGVNTRDNAIVDENVSYGLIMTGTLVHNAFIAPVLYSPRSMQEVYDATAGIFAKFIAAIASRPNTDNIPIFPTDFDARLPADDGITNAAMGPILDNEIDPLLCQPGVVAAAGGIGGLGFNAAMAQNYVNHCRNILGHPFGSSSAVRQTAFGAARHMVWSGPLGAPHYYDDMLIVFDAIKLVASPETVMPSRMYAALPLAPAPGADYFRRAAYADINVADGAYGAALLLGAVDNPPTLLRAVGLRYNAGAQTVEFANDLLWFMNNIPLAPGNLPLPSLRHISVALRTLQIFFKMGDGPTDVHGGSLYDAMTMSAPGEYDRIVQIAYYLATNNLAFDAKIKNIANVYQNTASRGVYLESSTQLKHYEVKYDDVLAANSSNLTGAFPRLADITDAVRIGPSILTYFTRDARDSVDAINILPANSLGSLESPNRPTDAASDDLLRLMEFGRRLDPDNNHVLFTSLAIILRNMTSGSDQKSNILVNNIADLPLFMKEKMRMYLPYFRNLFKEITVRGEFVRKFLQHNAINATRDWTGAAAPPNQNPWPWVLKDAPDTMTSDSVKNRFAGIIDSIIRGCNTLSESCERVLKEVGDEPKFFEVSQGSIASYKAQYGYEPHMPLSLALHIFSHNTNTDNYENCEFLPVHSPGEDMGKFHYGTRSLLHQHAVAPTFENTPGFANMIESYNLSADARNQVDKARAGDFLKDFVRGLRYINTLRHYRGNTTSFVKVGHTAANSLVNTPHVGLGPVGPAATDVYVGYTTGLFTRQDMYIDSKIQNRTNDRANGPTADGGVASDNMITIQNKSDVSINCQITGMPKKSGMVSFGIEQKLDQKLRLVEQPDKESQLKSFIEFVFSSRSNTTAAMHILNVLDLNIIPINVHAMMRDMPLVNLYNYAYTFDKMVSQLLYGKNMLDSAGKFGLDKVASAKDMLFKLLVDPHYSYEVVDSDQANGAEPVVHARRAFSGPLRDMMVGGANNGELGRPKFISDVIYNQALYGTILPDNDTEIGPIGNSHTANITNGEFLNSLQKSIYMYVDVGMTGAQRQARSLRQPVQDDPLANAAYDLAYACIFYRGDFKEIFDLIFQRVGTANSIYAGIGAAGPVFTDNSGIVNFVSIGIAFYCLALEAFRSNVGMDAPAMLARFNNEYRAILNSVLLAVVPPVRFVYGANYDAALAAFNGIGGAAAGVAKYFVPSGPITVGVVAVNVGGVAVNPANAGNIANLVNMFKTPRTLYPSRLQSMIRDHILSYMNEPDDQTDGTTAVGGVTQYKSIRLTNPEHDHVAAVGSARYDTVLIRNLLFIVNCYRIARMKLQRELTYTKAIIASSTPIVKPQLTELFGNNVDRMRREYSTRDGFGARFTR